MQRHENFLFKQITSDILAAYKKCLQLVTKKKIVFTIKISKIILSSVTVQTIEILHRIFYLGGMLSHMDLQEALGLIKSAYVCCFGRFHLGNVSIKSRIHLWSRLLPSGSFGGYAVLSFLGYPRHLLDSSV